MINRSPSPRVLPVLSDTLVFVALMPLSVILSFLTGDMKWVMVAGLAIPAFVAVLRIFKDDNRTKDPTDDLTGLPLRKAMETTFDEVFAIAGNAVRTSACVVVDLDSFHAFNERWGREAADRVLQVTAERLNSNVRKDDLVVRLEADAFCIALLPAERMTLDTVLALSERVLRAIAEPIPINGTNAYVSASVGIALASKIGARSGGAIIAAAERAMVEARSHGAGALRVYSPQMQTITKANHALGEDVSKGLEEGQIKAWFQPQISTDSGAVSGFEALARWTHPQRGPIMPNEFIPAIQAAGRSERLSEVMLYEALSALVAWERAGLKVPCVAVNFAGAELRNPRIIDKVKWELDRFGLTSDRLAIEVVESVVCETKDDIILRNIAALSEFGCRIDLDDFGTGHASISAIKRFRINRLKIDKSFVRRVDQDGDQQRMVAAILTMSHQMGIESLAEGVESLGEHSILSQLGCEHVQGFGIGRPMPLEETFVWLREHEKENAAVPRIGLPGRLA